MEEVVSAYQHDVHVEFRIESEKLQESAVLIKLNKISPFVNQRIADVQFLKD
jgi:hypothetical protein